MRLIDADEILKKQEHFVNVFIGEMAIVFVEDIENAPTISPDRLRSKGRWEAHKPDSRGYTAGFMCSACRDIVYTDYSMKECEYNFCPNCGADMREGG